MEEFSKTKEELNQIKKSIESGQLIEIDDIPSNIKEMAFKSNLISIEEKINFVIIKKLILCLEKENESFSKKLVDSLKDNKTLVNN